MAFLKRRNRGPTPHVQKIISNMGKKTEVGFWLSLEHYSKLVRLTQALNIDIEDFLESIVEREINENSHLLEDEANINNVK